MLRVWNAARSLPGFQTRRIRLFCGIKGDRGFLPPQWNPLVPTQEGCPKTAQSLTHYKLNVQGSDLESGSEESDFKEKMFFWRLRPLEVKFM